MKHQLIETICNLLYYFVIENFTNIKIKMKKKHGAMVINSLFC